jgi:predicted nuclease of restriction endonuclease-like RecB superfamily
VLGYRCNGETSGGYSMHRAPTTISVPKETRLTDRTIKYIIDTCGYTRDEYLEAWVEKIRAKPKLNCPRMQVPPAPASG